MDGGREKRWGRRRRKEGLEWEGIEVEEGRRGEREREMG